MPAARSFLAKEFFADHKGDTFRDGKTPRTAKIAFHNEFARRCEQGEAVRVTIAVYTPGLNTARIVRANGEAVVAENLFVCAFDEMEIVAELFTVDKADRSFRSPSRMFLCVFADECEQGEVVAVSVFAYGPGFNLLRITRAATNGDVVMASNAQVFPLPPPQ